jgi:hypothetical protein
MLLLKIASGGALVLAVQLGRVSGYPAQVLVATRAFEHSLANCRATSNIHFPTCSPDYGCTFKG